MSAVTVYTIAEELEQLRRRVEALENHEHGPEAEDPPTQAETSNGR